MKLSLDSNQKKMEGGENHDNQGKDTFTNCESGFGNNSGDSKISVEKNNRIGGSSFTGSIDHDQEFGGKKMEKKTCNCDCCNKPIFGKYYKQVAYEGPVCDYCAKYVCYQCYCCGYYFYLNANEEKEVGLCEDCASELMKCCETCGKYVMTQKAQYINGGYYCDQCAFDAAFGNDNSEK